MTDLITLHGSPGSPYTRKIVAVLRYRRMAYRLLTGGAREREGLPVPKVPLLPTVYLPDDAGALQPVTDSTPLIRRFEREVPGRHVIPSDPALAFLDALIEDYGDEWLTKAMFHYRWAFTDDVHKSATVLPNWMGKPLNDESLAALGKIFSERQIGRLRFVGSNAVTGATIQSGYERLIGVLNRHLARYPFLFGNRPGVGDFGLYGQLTQLAQFDPTPMALTTRLAPRVIAWTSTIDDLSGLEPSAEDWLDPQELPETLIALLGEIGRFYAPLLIANAKAVQTGTAELEIEIDGRPWVQQPFPYQVKCLTWLRADYAALPAASKRIVDHALAGSGCEILFQPDT